MVRRMVRMASLCVKIACLVLFPVSMTVVLSGCLALRPAAEISYTNGAVVTSLSSNASLAYTSSERSISGNGILMFRKPDQMRMVVLSPFGSVFQEIYVSGDFVTIIDVGNSIAFSGTFKDLPDKGDFSGWRYIHWLIEIDPPDSSRGNAVIERVNRFGQTEMASFENGFLISKSTLSAGIVKYGRYTAIQGAAFPLEITYESAVKERFTIQFEDPEINVPLLDSVFLPNLGVLRVYPLSRLR